MKIDLLDHGHGGSWLNEHRARQRALHKRIARTVHRLISAARDRVLDHTRDDYDPVRAARLLARRLKDGR
jgi:hypothetical protein